VERRPALSVLRLVYTTTPGFKSTRLHQHPSAVSGLRVLALVSGLLLSKIQPAWLPTDPGLRRVTKDSSSGLLRDHTLRSSLHGYLRIYCCKRLLALAPLSCKRPPGPGDYSITTALAIQVYLFSNKVRSFINLFTVYSLNGTTAEYDYSHPLHNGAPHYEIATTSTHCWNFPFINT
jgi:hypothetical protein